MQHVSASSTQTVRTRQILLFFVPLGLAASLITLSHVIINSVLSRAPNAELTIAAYTIALSIFTITERPAFLLRQTTSALSEDRTSFQAMRKLMLMLLGFTLVFGFAIGFTPLGELLFRFVFTTDDASTPAVIRTYRVLMFVTIFSALRCLYQGIIIREMKTKWLTIGMAVRLSVMYTLGLIFMAMPERIDGQTGAWLFLIGMAVEALVSWVEGRRIVRGLPKRVPDAAVRSVRDVIPFYRPLLYTAFISVIIPPSINAILGKTVQLELSIASYALALSVVNLINSFYTYVHQIVLNFYERDSRAVFRFALFANMLPGILVLLLAYSPLGGWFLGNLIGVRGELLTESLAVLRVMALVSIVFPWVDYCNGLCMLHKETRLMVWSQTGNVATTVLMLLILIAAAPHWNGLVGALAFSCGLVAEFVVIFLLLKRYQLIGASAGRKEAARSNISDKEVSL